MQNKVVYFFKIILSKICKYQKVRAICDCCRVRKIEQKDKKLE